MKAYAMDGEGEVYSIDEAIKVIASLKKMKYNIQLDWFHADGFPIPSDSAQKQFVEHAEFC